MNLIEKIRNSIESTIATKDEDALIGLGVIFELLWINSTNQDEYLNIIEKSPYRVEPGCKYYGKCGGCNMMHISPDYQRELRKNKCPK